MNKLIQLNFEKEQNGIKNRIFGLDILRACAILFVVVGHGASLYPSTTPKIVSRTINHIFGYDGVSIFFVLSGFLIGGILIKAFEKRQGEKKVLLNFWIRRWFRTLPPYFLILTTLLILNLLFTDGFLFSKIFPLNYFTFTQNLFYRHPDFFPEAWSLSIEEWFYLLIPVIILIFVFFKRSVKMSVLYTALSVLILITLFRFYRFSNISAEFSIWEWDSQFRKQVITRLDSLMYGVIGAFIQYYYRNYWLKYKKTLLCFGLSLFLATKYLIHVSVDSLYFCVFSFSVTSFATLLLLPFLSDFRTDSNSFIHKSITKISLISYSMYLTNLSIVQDWIIRKIPLQDITILSELHLMNIAEYGLYFLYWFLTIFLSMIIYKYFEVPMMNLRDNKRIKKWLRI